MVVLDGGVVDVVNPTLPTILVTAPTARVIHATAPDQAVEVSSPPVPVFTDAPMPSSPTIHVLLVPGPPGPPGGGGGGSVTELYDSNTPPANPTYPYLRLERDQDGDPTALYWGVP